ncbi:hypothetical protein HMPREF9525_02929 [Enterococcus faecium TX0133a04]|nr:hypothetical protein HMPREF9524_00614 [Enterococcus faecium TX0133a01]EFR71265.1 hypothetical protein HMPREF9526_01692 [Enterococcus faecium TX0133B]EFR74752.1 hypothetical protein HMPREF9523_01344 [Enterococcus faecium TX0133A]EFR76935.1 hypothetical protein HMPREF9527_02272 [Enterococcus faecium TX0133C]EFS05009.1 hypothetical protein HMPREF9525_02929 [Enterococcus faecium TX0133a04]
MVEWWGATIKTQSNAGRENESWGERRMIMKHKSLMPMNLQYFAEGDDQKFSFDDFKSFVESNEEAQKFIQSQSQSVADEQLEAWKQNNLDKIKQDTIKEYEESKKNKSPEQIQLEKLQAEFEAEKALRVTSDNKAFVAEQIAGLELDGELKESISQFMLNNLVSSDTDFTKNAVEGFTSVLNAINEKHADALKELQMKSAFGGTQQSNNQVQQNNETFTNPEEQLGQILQQFN